MTPFFTVRILCNTSEELIRQSFSSKFFVKVFRQSLSSKFFVKVFRQSFSSKFFVKVFRQSLSSKSFVKVFRQSLSSKFFVKVFRQSFSSKFFLKFSFVKSFFVKSSFVKASFVKFWRKSLTKDTFGEKALDEPSPKIQPKTFWTARFISFYSLGLYFEIFRKNMKFLQYGKIRNLGKTKEN